MARRHGSKLATTQIQKLRYVDGLHIDGNRLMLQGGPGGGSWVLRYSLQGRPKTAAHPRDEVWLGLGSLEDVPVREARAMAARYGLLLAQKIDPATVRNSERLQRAIDVAKAVLFRKCAEDLIEAKRAGWKNDKHAAQWESTLATHVYPVFGDVPVQAVDTALVVKALTPIWTRIPETATRVRSRIEAVLDRATALNYRSGDNPARWKGHLDKLLPELEKRKRVKHHAALPFDGIAEFIVAVRAQEGVSARALEFLILTAARTADVIGATWSEFDLEAETWTIPAARMKAHREHRIPLSAPAMTILRTMQPLGGEYVFPGWIEGRPLSNMAMLALLERMGCDELTVHGFRSTFRDWTAERTGYPREVCEAALAHVVNDQTEAAYRRGDLFEKRRRLMNEWAKFCETTKRGDVVPLRANAKGGK